MTTKHLSTQFDADLDAVSDQLMEMGGLVEQQIVRAMRAFAELDSTAAEQVIEDEHLVNTMEIEIDQEIGNVIARRQPAAGDLRLLMATSKTVTNLERVGDEARKIAKRAVRIVDEDVTRCIDVADIRVAGELAIGILRRALDAFSRLDATSAAQIVRDDEAIDELFRAFARKLIGYMGEDPRCVRVGLDCLSIAKAIERIGDHAKNIAEFVIYVVSGTDVRHVPRDTLYREAEGADEQEE
ncbi:MULTISPECIES: phosphate signaling complex protein PhoU [Paraburkholderia]|uniref:phosphate signaling complex protein PhoU n=1 Tax=Paraburkholderia TaxID=1822464 RepID=UPI001F243035|nr:MULTISPECIES: phosphate signaling complex protein PhoU [Paraburkholderia]